MTKINFLFRIFTFGLVCAFTYSTASAQVEKELKELLDMDLADLAELQVSGRGDVGSFGYRLSSDSSKVHIHGYTTNEYFDGQNSVSTFDNHYFNLFVGANIRGIIFPEIQLEYEHGGEEIQIRYAQVDIKISDAFIIRTGKFLLPSTSFNEYLYPEYINKNISRAFIDRNIVASAWAEVGVQIRGSFNKNGWQPFYSVYIVNGLQGEEGGDIRGMRNNHRDKTNDNKAIGGRIGFNKGSFEIGSMLYNGAYSADGKLNLMITGADAAYRTKKLNLRAQYLVANMEVTPVYGADITRDGFLMEASYIFGKRIEPVMRYDQIDFDDADVTKNKQRFTLGLNYRISSTAVAKISYEVISNDGLSVDDNLFGLQLAVGF
jgi:hypothetical protein